MFSDFLRFWIIFTKSIIVTLNSEHSANFENCHRNPFNNCHVSFIRRLICNIFLKPGAFIHWQIKPWGQKPNVFYCHAIIPKKKLTLSFPSSDAIMDQVWEIGFQIRYCYPHDSALECSSLLSVQFKICQLFESLV